MRIPNIRVLSPELDLLAEVDTYTSLMFKRSWQGVGDFEFHIAGDYPSSLLEEGNFIILDNDGRRAGVIRSCQQEDGGEGLQITVKGQTLNGLASQRVTVPLEGEANGGYDVVPALATPGDTPAPVSAETILKTYAVRHLISPLDAKRAIPNLHVADDIKRGLHTVWLSRFEQLDEVLEAVGTYTDMGWEIRADTEARRLIFDAVPGVDRSASQHQNSQAVFSLEFESLQSLTGYAGGVGEGAARTVLKVTNDAAEPIGLERFETFLDCGALELTGSDTAMSLEEEGRHRLQEYSFTESLTAEVPLAGSFLYRIHWNLGDLVTVVDRGIGVAADMRITQVAERYEARDMGLEVTFGAAPAHLGRVIRRLQNTVR